MCFEQFMDAYGFNIIFSVISGLITGGVTSYSIALYFKRRDNRAELVKITTQLLSDCHLLFSLTDKHITELALRKHVAFPIVQKLTNMTGSAAAHQNTFKNGQALRVKLGEVSREAFDLCIISIRTARIGEILNAENPSRFFRYFRSAEYSATLDELLDIANSCIDNSQKIETELSSVLEFPAYLDSVFSSMLPISYKDFTEQLDQSESEYYSGLCASRDALKKSNSKLASTLGKLCRIRVLR